MEPYLLIADQLDGLATMHEAGIRPAEGGVTLQAGLSAISFRRPMTPGEMRARADKLRKQWAKRYRGAPRISGRIPTHRPKGSHAVAACHRFLLDGGEVGAYHLAVLLGVVRAMYPTSGAYHADL